jgi:hypothetical protein
MLFLFIVQHFYLLIVQNAYICHHETIAIPFDYDVPVCSARAGANY